jgi:hypothetical protein
MSTLIFVIAAIAVFAAAIVLFARRSKAPAGGDGLGDPEHSVARSVDSTEEAVADAPKGATPDAPQDSEPPR